MALSDTELDELVDRIYEGYAEKTEIAPLTDDYDVTTEEAYEIQGRVFDRINESGRVLGHKLGLVSEAKQEQLGIPEPIFAPIVAETLLENEPIRLDDMIAPRIEAEIGLVLDETLEAPVTATDVLAATRGVVPVVEILESRFEDWRIPSAQDVIADLTSAGGVYVGESLSDVTDVDVQMESIALSVNGEIRSTGVGADIMGHPARAVAWLANRLAEDDERLEAGELLMTGGIGAAIDVEPGDVYHVQFANIGTLDIRAE